MQILKHTFKYKEFTITITEFHAFAKQDKWYRRGLKYWEGEGRTVYIIRNEYYSCNTRILHKKCRLLYQQDEHDLINTRAKQAILKALDEMYSVIHKYDVYCPVYHGFDFNNNYYNVTT